MSADLLAEFDSFYQAPRPSETASRPFQSQLANEPSAISNLQDRSTYPAHHNTTWGEDSWNVPASTHVNGNLRELENSEDTLRGAPFGELQPLDGWAGFEDTAVPTTQTLPRHTASVSSYIGVGFGQGEGNAISSTPQAYNHSITVQHQSSSERNNVQPQVSRYESPHKVERQPRDENVVLFDAEEDQEDDDFGDFENGDEEQAHHTSDVHAQANHSGIETRIPRRDELSFARKRQNESQLHSTTAVAAHEKHTVSQLQPSQPLPSRFDAIPAQLDAGTSDLSPTNIPPPALILGLFSSILNTAQSKLFDQLGNNHNSAATREAILKDSEAQTFLASYGAIIGVLARVIAGRKLRWKRDTMLAQSMRIGPASASGRSSGMKLAGVDKAENSREEREIEDILNIWRAQVGRLRSAVAIAGSGFQVPELSDSYVIRIAKEEDGGISASKPCAVCGLRRNERTNKVDIDVQDSFGEWWMDHWGHRTCKAFWEKHKVDLKSR